MLCGNSRSSMQNMLLHRTFRRRHPGICQSVVRWIWQPGQHLTLTAWSVAASPTVVCFSFAAGCGSSARKCHSTKSSQRWPRSDVLAGLGLFSSFALLCSAVRHLQQPSFDYLKRLRIAAETHLDLALGLPVCTCAVRTAICSDLPRYALVDIFRSAAVCLQSMTNLASKPICNICCQTPDVTVRQRKRLRSRQMIGTGVRSGRLDVKSGLCCMHRSRGSPRMPFATPIAAAMAFGRRCQVAAMTTAIGADLG